VGNIPQTVSTIIMKLLAKTAGERYQTAAGVENDLRRCLMEWETRGRIDDFVLGEDDTPDRLLIPEKLYGRAREIDSSSQSDALRDPAPVAHDPRFSAVRDVLRSPRRGAVPHADHS
jgi:hypothetical protein